MLPYQPNSENCLISCYSTEEMEPKNLPRQVADTSARSLPSFFALRDVVFKFYPANFCVFADWVINKFSPLSLFSPTVDLLGSLIVFLDTSRSASSTAG